MTNGLNGYEAIYKDEVIHEIAAGILRFAPVREESTPTLNLVNVQHTPHLADTCKIRADGLYTIIC